jgi:hypothetical protein
MLSERGGVAEGEEISSAKDTQGRCSEHLSNWTDGVHDPLDSINGSLPCLYRIHGFFSGDDCRSQRGTCVR